MLLITIESVNLKITFSNTYAIFNKNLFFLNNPTFFIHSGHKSLMSNINLHLNLIFAIIPKTPEKGDGIVAITKLYFDRLKIIENILLKKKLIYIYNLIKKLVVLFTLLVLTLCILEPVYISFSFSKSLYPSSL